MFLNRFVSPTFLPLAHCLSHTPISECWWCLPKYVDFCLYSVILPFTASRSLHFFFFPPDQRSGAPFHIFLHKPSFYFHSQFLFLYAAAAVNSSPRRDAPCLPHCCILSPDRTDALCYWTETRSWKSCRYYIFLDHLFSDSFQSSESNILVFSIKECSSRSERWLVKKTLFIHGDELMPHACFLMQFSSGVTFTQSSRST